jgi:hypothetical protein
MASMGEMQVALKNTFLELASNGDDDVGAYASSCPGSLEYEDLLSDLQDNITEVGYDGATTKNQEHDRDGIESAPNVHIGPEWGGPLRQCMNCCVEAEVGAVDPDGGLWSSLPPYCHDSM